MPKRGTFLKSEILVLVLRHPKHICRPIFIFQLHHMNNQAPVQFSKDDTKSFTAIYQLYQPQLYHYAVKFTRDPAQAKDIVTDTFINFWKKDRVFPSQLSLRGFLYVSTHNAIINWHKARRRLDTENKSLAIYSSNQWEATTHDQIVHRELSAVLSNALDGLSPQVRKVCRLYFYEGLSYHEIAEQLHTSRYTIRNHRVKGTETLKRKFPRKKILL